MRNLKKIIFIYIVLFLIIAFFLLSTIYYFKKYKKNKIVTDYPKSFRKDFRKNKNKYIQFIDNYYSIDIFMDKKDNIDDVESMFILDDRYLYMDNENLGNLMIKDLVSGRSKILLTRKDGFDHPEDFIIINKTNFLIIDNIQSVLYYADLKKKHKLESLLIADGKNFITLHSITLNKKGDLFIADKGKQEVDCFINFYPDFNLSNYKKIINSKDGLLSPQIIRIDSKNCLYITDEDGKKLYKVDENNNIKIILNESILDEPQRIAIDENDNIYITDSGLKNKTGKLILIDKNGIPKVLVEFTNNIKDVNGIAVRSSSEIYFSSGDPDFIWKLTKHKK